MSGQFPGRLPLAVSQGHTTATCSGISFLLTAYHLPFFPSLRDGYHVVKGPLLRIEVAALILVVKPQLLSITEFLSGTD